ALMPRLEASNDFFIRTSDDEHKRRVQEVLQKVHDNGYTHLGLYEGWYCPRCADFKVENEIGPDNTCPIHEIPLVREQEENWFFQLSAFQERLEQLYASQPDFVQPATLRHYLSRDVQFGADGSVSMESLGARYDGELANELGNLASRSIAMLRRYRDGNVPDGALDLEDEFAGLADDVATRLSGADLTGA